MPRHESWRWVGDRALLREIRERDLVSANAAARALHRRLVELGAGEVEDVVPAARSVLVVLRPGAEPGRELVRLLEEPGPHVGEEVASRAHEIAVTYGGAAGPDLEPVADLLGLSEETVVRLHSGAAYTVGFLGFSPGFAYLLGLPRELVTPRLATPRTRIPAGSVAIAGEFSGIYPRATPGGWRLIGRAEVELFDPRRDPPALLAAGDRVRFVPQ